MPTITTKISDDEFGGGGVMPDGASPQILGDYLDLYGLFTTHYMALAVSLALAFAAYAINWWSVKAMNSSTSGTTWWSSLRKPSRAFYPLPDPHPRTRKARFGVLAVVWSLMYPLQAVAIWIAYALPVYNHAKMVAEGQISAEHPPVVHWWIIGTYLAQLAFNAAIGPCLFYFRDLSIGFFFFMLLVGTLMYNLSLVSQVSNVATYMLNVYALSMWYLLVGYAIMWYHNEGKQLIADAFPDPDAKKKKRIVRKPPTITKKTE
eukprot:GEZU01032459.1.p1 GENE.GEZU01032459.1~~GEZU01032459.1.p1  ORF type:complete len:262 (-),score=47.27 GEZU01032459.1:403-1188(-)